MTRNPRPECRVHRRALTALVFPEVADAAGAFLMDVSALRHVAICEHCRSDVERQRLAAHRLRRDLAAARLVEPGDQAWPALERRVVRRPVQTPRAARSSLGGILGATLAAALFAAAAAPALPTAVDEPGFDPRSVIEQGRRDADAEARWLRSHARLRVPARPETAAPERRAPGLARYGETGQFDEGATPPLPSSAGYRVQ